MIDGSEITIESKEGKLKLVLSEYLLLLSKEDKLSIKLSIKPNPLTVNFHFTDDDKHEEMTSRFEIGENGALELFFNKWYSDTWVENISAYPIASKIHKIELLMKVRIIAGHGNDMRNIIISIWEKLKA